MLKSLFDTLVSFIRKRLKLFGYLVLASAASMAVALIIGKIYQHWDDDPQRGAIAMKEGRFGESYEVPVYLEQGWDESDSLWYYNTTQGSNLLPYDLFMALEQKGSEELFRSAENFDYYRYLPQKKTFFNPDALAVGFVKDTYKGKEYLGYTCAACHTSQVNYNKQAIRIDGGPAMADMVGYLTAMQNAMKETIKEDEKRERFVNRVLERKNDYKKKDDVIESLKEWTQIIATYNAVNHSSLKYGFARLDAFGRIYNRVLQHVINKEQARDLMLMATNTHNHERMLTVDEVDLVLKDIEDPVIIGNKQFAKILENLTSDAEGFPNLSTKQLMRLRKYLFNEPNAPVSYPFLWDITHSDYVQWNGLANNATVGPLGRNAGEVTGVFATLDWQASDASFSLGSMVSGQSNKKKKIDFESSIDLTNLQRIESHLRSLQSPLWDEKILGKINKEQASRGQLIYAEYCQACHEVIDRTAWDRIVIAKMSKLDSIGTDPVAALNSVQYTGKTGNFKDTYQGTDAGTVIMGEEAPVAMILTATTKGVVTTPDADKWLIRRWLDLIYVIAMSLFDNEIKASVKSGDYIPDTTANPFNSLLAYKGRSLNGIWATAPYLHNGSVPTLYDLLLPAEKREGDPEGTEYRPESFMVGSREFDTDKVGFRSEGYDGFKFKTFLKGNSNAGHEYAAGRTNMPNGKPLPPLNKEQREDLLEYLKTL